MVETITNFQALNELISKHIMTILQKELGNTNCIHLYAVGENWLAFEKSAFALSKLFKDTLSPIVIDINKYPFPVIMCFVYYEEIEFGRRKISLVKKAPDYLKIRVDTFDIARFFAIPPNSAFHGLLEEFLFIYQRYKIYITLSINSLGRF